MNQRNIGSIGRATWFALSAMCLLILGACRIDLPPAPTLIPSETPTISPTPLPITPSPTLTPTAPPTLTAVPSETPPPTVTLPATKTLPPPTATPDNAILSAPTVIALGPETISLNITESQINAVLARRFDTAPLANYRIAPRVSLGDSTLTLTLRIVPQNAPSGSAPQVLTLQLGLSAPGGLLETVPNLLTPLNTGVGTQQVKAGESLLLQSLLEIIRQALGTPQILISGIDLRADGLSLIVIRVK